MTLIAASEALMRRWAQILLPILLVGCSEQDRETARLASGCIKASPDNRVKLSGSWSNSFDVEVAGNDIVVRTEVPVGIALTGRIKFGHREFHCRRVGDRIEFVRSVWK